MKVSIITTVYDSIDTIETSIKSVLGQSYKDIEYIIIDGGSTDGTIDIVNKYKSKIAVFVSERDSGIYDAMNKGIKLATGDIIGILNSDDFYFDNYTIEKIVNNFIEYGNDSLYGDLVYVDAVDTNKIIRYWKAGNFKYHNLKLGWMPPHPTFFVRREIYQKLGTYNLEYKISADYDLMLRFLGKFKISVSYLPQILVKMRVGGNSNKTIGNIIRKSLEDYKIIKANNIGGVYTLMAKNLSKIPQFFMRY